MPTTTGRWSPFVNEATSPFAYSGSVYPQIVGRTPFIRRTTFDYVGQPSWGIVVDFNARTSKPGDTVSGTIYAVCR